MKVLMLTHVVPYPPEDGHSLRVYHLSRALSREHEVTLSCVTPSEAGERELAALREFCLQVVVIKVPPTVGQGCLKHLWHLITSAEPIALGPYLPDVQKRLDELLQQTEFDVVQVEVQPLTRYVERKTQIVKVQDVHDVEYEILERLCGILPAPERFYRRLDAQKLKRFECHAWRSFGHCLAISQPVADTIRRRAPRAKVWMFPNGVDSPPEIAGHANEQPDSLAFVGDYGYSPNVDAVHYFCDKILPAIETRCPDVSLHVIGKNPPDTFKSLKARKVTVTGYVEDVRARLSNHSVIVVPLRAGSGVRNKILEAWAMGKPVVSTSLGAEGLAISPGENILIADSPANFAEAVLSLLANPGLRRRLGQAGWETVRQCYSWESATDSVLQAYREIEAELRARRI